MLIPSSEDSDDEEKPAKKITKKPTPKKNTKENKSEPTTTASYFASTGKNKILRTSPLKPKKPEPKEEYFLDDEEFDEGIYAEEFRKLEDDYKEGEGEVAEASFAVVVEKNRQVKSKAKASPPARKQRSSLPKGKHVGVDSIAAGDEEEEDEYVKPKRRSAATPATRKRKPAQLHNEHDDDDDDDDEIEQAKPAVKASKPATKKAKATPKKSKEAPQESESVRKILDSVPIFRPPTPPPPTHGEPKKFNDGDFKRRQGAAPTAPGSKEIPVGEENCLTGLTFVFTGILESLAREDGQQLVKKYGG